jgi:5-methylcytosine-specific restriction endonuclease McrA
MIQPIPKPSKRLKQPKPLRQLGKIGKALIKQRRDWIKDNPPDYRGWWDCYLCPKPIMSVYDMDVEHVEDKSTHPELRFVRSNLKAAHSECNLKKKRHGGV